MKVLLLSLPDPSGIHVFRFHAAGFGSSFVMPNPEHRYDVYPPIYETYAAAILENQGTEARILDCQSPNLGLTEISEEIARYDPSMIVSRICLPSYHSDLEIMTEIKKTFPDILTVGWGGMCKALPEEPENVEDALQDILEQLSRYNHDRKTLLQSGVAHNALERPLT